MNNDAASKTTKKTSDSSPGSAQAYQKLNIGREFLDTTWRMAVPVILFASTGLLADRQLGSKPWLTLLGTIAGFVFAAQLVKRQIGGMPDDNSEAAGLTNDKEKNV